MLTSDHPVVRGSAWFMALLGTALLGGSFGSGIVAVPVKANLNCTPLIEEGDACRTILGQIETLSLTMLVGGSVALACGIVAIALIRRGGDSD